MDIKITFQSMDHSGPLESHARQKLRKIADFFKDEESMQPFTVELWMKANKLHPHHRAELHVKTPQFNLNAHDEGTDMYVSVDNAIDKMVKLITKEKSKVRDKQRKADTDKKIFTKELEMTENIPNPDDLAKK
ncbi:MAG: ribosome-associated translation inhibitor RaiA [Epsilonproteobacteria bacterium]|nr:ribosome-associated translation inhibitor RaiA [Campylobacterota bacterium]